MCLRLLLANIFISSNYSVLAQLTTPALQCLGSIGFFSFNGYAIELLLNSKKTSKISYVCSRSKSRARSLMVRLCWLFLSISLRHQYLFWISSKFDNIFLNIWVGSHFLGRCYVLSKYCSYIKIVSAYHDVCPAQNQAGTKLWTYLCCLIFLISQKLRVFWSRLKYYKLCSHARVGSKSLKQLIVLANSLSRYRK